MCYGVCSCGQPSDKNDFGICSNCGSMVPITATQGLSYYLFIYFLSFFFLKKNKSSDKSWYAPDYPR